MMLKLLALAVTTAVLSGCTMIPHTESPKFSAAQSWNNIPGYELPVGQDLATQVHWKAFFGSEQFHLIIDTALHNNKSLKTAALNIEEARVLYRGDRADSFPHLYAGGSGTIVTSSDASSSSGVSTKNKLYEANLGIASYELDLFGKIRSHNASSRNDYLSSTQAHAVVRNALIAETANAYLQLLADQKLLALTEKTLEAQKNTYDILSQSLGKGISTGQAVARTAIAVETAQVNFHQYSRFVAQDKSALFLLMGVPERDGFLPQLTLDDVKIKANLNPGLPSDVLLMRPDVQEAEYQLIARNANIGVARAAFLPSISLTGTYGLASTNLDDLFANEARGAWSFFPVITLPIFQGGRNKANLNLTEIRKEKAVINYEAAIQIAFREVADELAARKTLDEQLSSQKRLVAAAQKVYDITDARYNSGIDSFLDVLDAQRELYVFQQNEIEIERLRLSNFVNLYKVLGGGSEEQLEVARVGE